MAEGSISAESLEHEAVSFELETDDAPEFWQFLNGLAGDDLLVELIVNDLDAGATRTEIRFEADRLVCAGNGRAVDEDGWKRLRLLRGAGRKAPAKKGLFGVKNHGLKACFTIGNDIVVRSAGLQVLQTLFAFGASQPAYPGVRRPPIPDAGAPALGAAIEVTYRREPFRAPDGEPFEFAAATDEVLEATFLEAMRDFPRRLLGIIRPTVLEAYELHLQHHRLGGATFRYKCGRWSMEKGVLSFSRTCEVAADDGLPASSTYERAFAKRVALGADADHATFFRAGSYRSPSREVPGRQERPSGGGRVRRDGEGAAAPLPRQASLSCVLLWRGRCCRQRLCVRLFSAVSLRRRAPRARRPVEGVE